MSAILGIGECMVALDAAGPLEITPHFTRSAGGDAYNTLATLSKLGHTAKFLTKIADDGMGLGLMAQFAADGVDSSAVRHTTEGTNGLYLTALKADGGHDFIYYRQHSAASKLRPEDVTPDLMHDCKLVYATGVTQALSLTSREALLRALQMAKKHNIPVAFDTNYRPSLWESRAKALAALEDVLPLVDILLPSLEDMRLLLDTDNLHQILDYFYARNVPIIALKQGRDGIVLATEKRHEIIPGYQAPSIVDTIGAGDAFNGGFLHGFLAGHRLSVCTRYGAATAALSLRGRGPLSGLPTLAEVENLLDTPSARLQATGPMAH